MQISRLQANVEAATLRKLKINSVIIISCMQSKVLSVKLQTQHFTWQYGKIASVGYRQHFVTWRVDKRISTLIPQTTFFYLPNISEAAAGVRLG